MTITRSNIQKQLIPGLRAVTGLSYGSVQDELQGMFDVLGSDRSFEEEVLMTGFGEAQTKSEGAAVAYDDAQEAWTARYNHETVALAYALTEEMMEDNLYETEGRLRADGLGRAMASAKQQKGADVYNNAFTGGAYAGGDGVALISDSHPLVNGGTLDNKATADLSEAALESAIIAIEEFIDDRGILINAMGDKLIIPTQLQFTANKILYSDLSTRIGVNPTTSTNGATNLNDTNALKGMGVLPGGIHINRRLTDEDAWFIRTDVPQGLQMFNRVGLTFKEDGDFDTGNVRFKARERYSFGWTNPRGLYGSDGSAS